MFINRDSIEVFTGSYYYPQFIGSSEPYPETVTVKPGEIIIIPIDPYKSTFKMPERDFHNFYELLR